MSEDIEILFARIDPATHYHLRVKAAVPNLEDYGLDAIIDRDMTLDFASKELVPRTTEAAGELPVQIGCVVYSFATYYRSMAEVLSTHDAPVNASQYQILVNEDTLDLYGGLVFTVRRDEVPPVFTMYDLEICEQGVDSALETMSSVINAWNGDAPEGFQFIMADRALVNQLFQCMVPADSC